MAEFQVIIDETLFERMLFEENPMAVMLEKMVNQFLQAEMTELVGAEHYERSDERRGYRNGSYPRQLTTRVGTLELMVPRDRAGRFQSSLFERYQRSEKALVLAMMEMVVNGVSTRKVRRVTRELCGREFSKATVSRLCEGLDEMVTLWNERSLEDLAYPFLIVDAMVIKVRRQKAVRSTTAYIAVGINEEGYREILGLQIGLGETGEGWRRMFKWLNERGLGPVDVVASDAHPGLVEALREQFPGAAWQRCQEHFRRNVLDLVPSELEGAFSEALDAIFYAEDQEDARQAFEELDNTFGEDLPRAVEKVEEGLEDVITVLALPDKYRQRLQTTNMMEREIREVRRREGVIGIFPNIPSSHRLLGAYMMETHEEWSTGRRYFRMEEYFAWKEQLEREGEKPFPASERPDLIQAEEGIYTTVGT